MERSNLTDHTRRQIRQALEQGFQPAPWLRRQVIQGVRLEQARAQRKEGTHMDTINWTGQKRISRPLVVTAAAVAAAIVAVLLLATRTAPPAVSQASPTVAYLNAAHQGWDSWYRLYNFADSQCSNTVAGMPLASQCRADTIQLKAETQAFLDRLDAVAVPAQLRDRHQTLKQGLRDIEPLLDQRIAALDSGNLQALDAANLAVFRQEVHGIHLAIISIDCWPKAAEVKRTEDGGSLGCVQN